MNKKKLVVAIACALFASVNQQVFAANNIEIVSGLDQTNISGSPSFTSTNDNAKLGSDDISAVWTGSVSDTVSVSTGILGTNLEPGDLTLNADIDFNNSNYSTAVLNLTSENNININAQIYDADLLSANSLTLNLSPTTGVVNLTSSIGSFLNTTVLGDLFIGTTGVYNLINASDSLSVTNLQNDGVINQSAGSNTVTSISINSTGSYDMSGGTLNATDINMAGSLEQSALAFINTTTLSVDGGSYDINGGIVVTDAMTVDNSGVVTQSDGGASISAALTINDTGSYNLNGGNLNAGSIVTAGTGAFNYIDGGLRLTDSDLTVDTNGLLGANVSIDANEVFGAVNQIIGVDDTDIGTVTQTGGSNDVDAALTINDGSNYTQSGGTTTAQTLNINSGAAYNLNGGTLDADQINNSGDMTVASVMNVAFAKVYNLLTGGTLSSDELIVDGDINQQTGGTNTVTTDLTVNDTGKYTQAGGDTTAATVNITTTGQYDISGGTLTAETINNAGALNQSGTASVNANSVVVDGGNYSIGGGDVTTNTMAIGNVAADSGAVTQTAGNATVNNALTINDGGSYNMDGGNLSAGSIVNTGAFNYTDGGVRLTNSDLSVDSNGLLGATLNINSGEVFGAVNQVIGVDAVNTGLVVQTDGENTVDQALTINDGSSYTQSGGANSVTTLNINSGGTYVQSGGANSISSSVNINAGGSYDLAVDQVLSVGSLQVDSLGVFSGAGSVNATGDITDQRTVGSIDASYSGANVSLAADVMDGAILASESISLDSIVVNGDITGTAVTLTDGATLNGAVNLQPYVLNDYYNNSVITNNSGNSVINGEVNITPLLVNRHINVETVDDASIDMLAGSLTITGDVNASQMNMGLNVAAGTALSLQGNTSALALTSDVATGGSLSLGNTTASSFMARGTGGYQLDGSMVTGASGTPGNVVVDSASLLITGVNGAIDTNGGTIIIGTDDRYINTASLTIDNSVAANSNRIGDSTDIQLSTGSQLTINGHATDDVIENAGSLLVGYLDNSYTSSNYRDFVANVDMNSAGGVTEITFDDFQMTSASNSRVNRIDFSTNGTFGGNERILFDVAPTLTNGLVLNATINGQEFVTYENAAGIKSATTATNNFVSGENVFVNADTNLVANTSINSLAVTTANITGTGNALTLNSGNVLLSGTSVIDPAINFGASQGQILVTGDSTFSGGVNGINGLFINGGGRLELAGTGSISGETTVNAGDLVLSADNALLGSDLVIHSGSGLDIGATTQNVSSLQFGTYADFTGAGSIVALNSILDQRGYYQNHTVDANYQSLSGNVTVYADVMNGNVDAAGTANIGRSASYTYNHVTMNGNVSAADINAYGTFNGDMAATSSINFSSSTVNGIISGTADVSGYATLYNANTYTGSTSGYFSLRGNGSILNSSDVSGSLAMYTNDGEANLDRIGDTTQINLNSTGRSLNLIGSGSEFIGVNVSEDVGVISVTDNSEANINIDNSLNGTAILTADALTLGTGSLVFLSLGDSSQLMFDAAPVTVGSSVVLDGVYIEKDILGSLMPTWTTYGVNGVEEVAVAETSIASASPGQFIRVTDAVNADLASNQSIGAINVDTTQTMTGAGTLTVESGQMVFWQDNTIDIAAIDFGANQGFLANAGTNTINSVLSGSNGLRKMGQGKIVLGGNNTYTGTTLISSGEIEVTGAIEGDVDIATSSSVLTIVDTGTVENISNNSGNINLINAIYTNELGNTVSNNSNSLAYFNMDENSSLINAGNMNNQRVYNYGSVNNSGYIYALSNFEGATLNHTGSLGSLYNRGNASVSSGSTIGSVTNYSNLTSNGVIHGDITNYGTFVNNRDLTLDGSSYNRDELNNYSAATFTNNVGKTITVSNEADIYTTGAFNNNGTINFNNAKYTQNLSGTFTNNVGATVAVNGSSILVGGTYVNKGDTSLVNSDMTIGLNDEFINRGTVNIDSESTITGDGTYRQLWSSGNSSTTVVNGIVEADMEISSGELSGAGYIVGDLIIGPAGTVRPGNSPGLLTIGGDFTLEQGADLFMEIVWDNDTNSYLYDELAVGGSFTALGNIEFDLGIGVDFSIFDTTNPEVDPLFSLTDFFTDEEGMSLELAVLTDTNIKISDSLGESYRVLFEVDEITGELAASVSAVPVPAAAWLFGSGLISLAGVARRRKAA